MMKSKLLTILIAFVLILNISCKKEQPQAINLPPESSMFLDVSNFKQNKKSSDIILDDTTKITNWANSATRVVVWDAIIFTFLAVPVAAFSESFNHEPAFKDGKWIWEYDYSAPLGVYSARLEGSLSGSEINWEMYISKSGLGSFNEFLWYKGVSSVDQNNGTWTMYKSPTSQVEYLGITWSKNDENNTSSIKFENIENGSIENGGYISQGITEDDLNAFFDIFNKGQNNLTQIQWNTLTKEGRIRDSVIYSSDYSWHCWDSTLHNKICN